MNHDELLNLRARQVARLEKIGDESPRLRGARIAIMQTIATIDEILED